MFSFPQVVQWEYVEWAGLFRNRESLAQEDHPYAHVCVMIIKFQEVVT